MVKKFKQIKVEMLRDSKEFGISMVSVEGAKLGEEREVFGGLKGKIIFIWNTIIEVEEK